MSNVDATAGLREWTRYERLKGDLYQRLQPIGVQTWGTKSFEFWTLLGVMLWSVRPESILELGSGRSTSYLGDYAQKEGAALVSIEQNRFFAYRVQVALRAGFVNPRFVHHVPVRGNWYDLAVVQRLAPEPCQFLFVDGPVGEQESRGSGVRTERQAVQWLSSIAAGLRALVVDDLQRPVNVGLAHQLADAAQLEPFYLNYTPSSGVHNIAMVAVATEDAVSLRSACRDIGIAVYSDRDALVARAAVTP